MLIDGLESCGLLVDYRDVFISSLNSHSEGSLFNKLLIIAHSENTIAVVRNMVKVCFKF